MGCVEGEGSGSGANLRFRAAPVWGTVLRWRSEGWWWCLGWTGATTGPPLLLGVVPFSFLMGCLRLPLPCLAPVIPLLLFGPLCFHHLPPDGFPRWKAIHQAVQDEVQLQQVVQALVAHCPLDPLETLGASALLEAMVKQASGMSHWSTCPMNMVFMELHSTRRYSWGSPHVAADWFPKRGTSP